MTEAAWNASQVRILLRGLRADQNGERIFVSVTLESGEQSESRTLAISAEQYCELNLKRGELTEEMFDRIEEASRFYAAIRCGENLLSYGPATAQALTAKIVRHGHGKAEATAAANHLRRRGLINESEDLRRELEKCLRKHWGAGRIRSHLWTKGFDRDTLEELPMLLEEIDFTEHCVSLIRKHYGGAPTNKEERNRITASLYRYGYTLSEIKEAFLCMSEEE